MAAEAIQKLKDLAAQDAQAKQLAYTKLVRDTLDGKELDEAAALAVVRGASKSVSDLDRDIQIERRRRELTAAVQAGVDAIEPSKEIGRNLVAAESEFNTALETLQTNFRNNRSALQAQRNEFQRVIEAGTKAEAKLRAAENNPLVLLES